MRLKCEWIFECKSKYEYESECEYNCKPNINLNVNPRGYFGRDLRDLSETSLSNFEGAIKYLACQFFCIICVKLFDI